MSKAEQGGSGERLEQHIDVPEEVNRKSSPYFRVSFVCRAEVLSSNLSASKAYSPNHSIYMVLESQA